MRRPVVFGEVLFDVFPDGHRVLGGAPFNVAWHLAALGADPLFVSRVGDDAAGEEVAAAMAGRGLSADGLQRDPERPTGRVEVTLDEAGAPSYEIVRDRAWDAIDPGAAERAVAAGGPAALVYHGTLAARSERSAAALERLIAAARAPVFVDVNLRPPFWSPPAVERMLDRARRVKLNQDELGELAGSGALAAARRLCARHRLELLVVTRGAAGALAVAADGSVLDRPAPRVEAVDTVGAGDAFAAVLILGRLHGWPLAASLERAAEMAAAVCRIRGAIPGDDAFYRPFRTAWGVA